jgi:hypothetical protein
VLSGVDPLIQVPIFMAVACQIVLGLSRQGCNFMLNMVQYVIQLTFMRNQPNLSQRDQKLMADFPVDIRSATKQFFLNGKHTIYATCPNPNCHCTYKPTFKDDSPIPEYPKYCTHQAYRGGPSCGERLLRPRQINNVELQVPVKPFVYFNFKDWVGGLMAHPGFKDLMDSAWDATELEADELHDIFDGTALKNFAGPDGKHFRLGNGEARYVFSLCIDFFNPLGNKITGKKISCGIISLVCLNLPPHLRYKPENMFLAGIIPGPHEPPTTMINHYLRPIVDDLLEFWEPGVSFSRTNRFHNGRLCRCALVALVCDAPASRKVAGFANPTHQHFCMVCHSTQADRYGRTDTCAWQRQTQAECASFSNQYKDATHQKQRQSIFYLSGVRWSELSRLPYFDVTQHVVVDAMHNLFLGLIKEHLEGVLGIRDEKEQEQQALVVNLSNGWKEFSRKEQQSVNRLRKWLEMSMANKLRDDQAAVTRKFARCHECALHFVCSKLKCQPKATGLKCAKSVWVDVLLAWVSVCDDQQYKFLLTLAMLTAVETTRESARWCWYFYKMWTCSQY